MDTEDFIVRLRQAILALENRKKAAVGKFVMASNDYVQVRAGYGLNGTNVNVRCAFTACKAVCYSDENVTIRSADYYLKDGAGNPILLKPMKAEELFSKEIATANEVIDFIKKSAQ